MSNESLEKNTRVVNASSILRENLQSLDSSSLTALEESGLITEKALKTALSMKNGLKRAGKDYRKDDRFKRLLENQVSKNVNEAVRNGNLSQMAHLNGRTHDSSSISQFHRIKKLQDVLSVQGRSFVFKGDPDMGKTNLALLMAEIWRNETGGRVYTNMKSVKAFKTVTNFQELKKEFEKDDKPKLMVVEDASNHFSAYGEDRQVMEDYYRPFSNELAKNNAIMFLLGHTGMDIHADARRKSLLVEKPSVKKTKIYKGIKNGEGVDELLKLTEIPKTAINYDSTEKTEWTWFNEDEEDEDMKERKEIKKEIVKRLNSGNQVVKTVEVDFNNAKVAKVMRKLAEQSEDYKFDASSPKSIKKYTL